MRIAVQMLCEVSVIGIDERASVQCGTSMVKISRFYEC